MHIKMLCLDVWITCTARPSSRSDFYLRKHSGTDLLPVVKIRLIYSIQNIFDNAFSEIGLFSLHCKNRILQ